MARTKGAVGKNKAFLMSRLQDMYGERFHPILRIAENANRLDELSQVENDVATIKAATDAWAKIAEYTEPKLSAVTIENDSSLTVSVQRKRYDAGAISNDTDSVDS
jgi:hypothetical protein